MMAAPLAQRPDVELEVKDSNLGLVLRDRFRVVNAEVRGDRIVMTAISEETGRRIMLNSAITALEDVPAPDDPPSLAAQLSAATDRVITRHQF